MSICGKMCVSAASGCRASINRWPRSWSEPVVPIDHHERSWGRVIFTKMHRGHEGEAHMVHDKGRSVEASVLFVCSLESRPVRAS